MVNDVVDNLVLEILKTRGIRKNEGKFLLFTLRSSIAFQPYRFNKITNKFESSGNNIKTKWHSILVLMVAFLTFSCGFLKNQGLENVLIRIFITSCLLSLAYVKQFTQTTAANFTLFINRLLGLKKRLTPSKPRNNSHRRDVRVIFVKIICASVEYFPELISVICAIIPDSAFNPLEIVNVFFNRLVDNRPFLSKVILLIQIVASWTLWSSIIPAVQLTASARLIFPFASLKHCTSLLYE